MGGNGVCICGFQKETEISFIQNSIEKKGVRQLNQVSFSN